MAIDAGSAVGYLLLDISDFDKNLENAKKAMGDYSKDQKNVANDLKDVGGAMKKTGDDLTKFVSLPLLGAGAASVMTAANFQKSMSEVQAVSGATADDFEALTKKAKEVGATTIFSATESANALKYMAMAGWDAQQMMNGIEGVALLAAASGEELALTSDIVTNAITAFGLSAKDTTMFVDVLAMAANASNTGVAELGESFKYVAPVAGALNYSIQDVATALGIMANSGIKGSQAGTALRASLSRMAKPTKNVADYLAKLGLYSEGVNKAFVNADGSSKELSETIKILRDKFKGLTEAQQAEYAAAIFGQEAMSGMLAIITSSEQDYNKLANAIDNSAGTTKEMADIMQNNLLGKFELLKSASEDVAISMGDFLLPKITDLLVGFTGLLDKFNGMDEGFKNTVLNIGIAVTAAGPLISVVGNITSGVGSLIGTFGALTAGTLGPAGWFGLALAAAGLLAGGIATIVLQHRAMYEEVYKIRDAVNDSSAAFEETNKKFDETMARIEASTSLAEPLIERLAELEKQSSLTNDEQLEYAGIIARVQELLPELNIEVDKNTGLLKDGAVALQDQVQGWKDLAIAQAMQDKVTELISNNTKLMVDQQVAKNDLKRGQEESAALETEFNIILRETEERLGMVAGSLDGINFEGLRKNLQDIALTSPEFIPLIDRLDEWNNRSLENEESTRLLKEEIAKAQKVIDEMTAEITLTEQAAKDLAISLDGAGTSSDEYAKKMRGARDSTAEFDNDVGTSSKNVSSNYNKSVEEIKRELEKMVESLDKTSLKSDEVTGAISTGNEEMVKAVSKELDKYKGKNEETMSDVDRNTKTVLEALLTFYKSNATKSANGYVDGIVTGMRSGIPEIEEMARKLADAANTAFNKRLKIESPSKVGIKSGYQYPLGVSIGMLGGLDLVQDTSKKLADAVSFDVSKSEFSNYGREHLLESGIVNNDNSKKIDMPIYVQIYCNGEEINDESMVGVGKSAGNAIIDEMRSRGLVTI